jgi:hypothetical protein
MISLFYTKTTVDEHGIEHTYAIPAIEIPTFYQFRYLYYKEFPIDEVINRRKGKKEFKLNHNANTKNEKFDAMGPGYRFEIDATYPPIYLVNSIKDGPIGKPVVYHVIDTFTTLIAGIYVGIGYACWEGAASAIYNCIENKVDYCKKYGLEITDGEWPTTMLPIALRGDRGELCGKLSEKVIENLGVFIDTTPSFMANMKGTVEGSFNIQERKFKSILNGVIENDYRKRGGSDARTDAKMNLKEFTKCVIRCVINHNNKVMDHYPKSEGMIRDNVVATPANIWYWGIKNITGNQRSISSDYVQLNLMRSGKAKITKSGIEFNGRNYLCEKGNSEKWHIRARNLGIRYIDIRFDPRNMNNIYLVNSNGFEVCILRKDEVLYLNRAYEEIIDYINSQKIDSLLLRDHANNNNASLYRGLIKDKKLAEKNLRITSKKDLRYFIKEKKAIERLKTQYEEAFKVGQVKGYDNNSNSDAKVQNPRRNLFNKIAEVVGGEKNE